MSGKTRIAFLITDLDAGGAERNLATLAAGLDRARFDVAVASLMPPGRIGGELAAKGVPVLDLGMTHRANVFAFCRLVRWLKRTRPDILHTWLFHANVLGRLAAKLAGVPHVVSSIRVAEPRRWHLALDRLTAGRAEVILVNSPSLQDYAAEHGIPRKKLRVIPNAVDLARFTAAPHAKRETPVALFVGRLSPQKGLDVLLRAAARVPRVRFRVVGDGPDRGALERLARELRLANVEFAGPSDRVPELLADADMLVLPSRWEGSPNVVLEAMAAGVPVVATNAVGTRDLVTDGVDGVLVAVDDAAALASAIDRIAGDSRLTERLAAAGRATAAKYSPETMIQSHRELYLSLLGC